MKLRLPVLDHGFVAIRNVAGPTRRTHDPEDEIEMDGADSTFQVVPLKKIRPFDADDVDPANAARISFDNLDANRARDQDLKLCDYLMKNTHTSPFEMIEIWIEMKMPIFVARQFVRHRTVSINEVSGRYVQLPKEWYIPALQDVRFQTKNKKQGGRSIDNNNTQEDRFARAYLDDLHDACRISYQLYERAINGGIAHEQARLFLHLNQYTHWIWKQDLHNLMHFLSLRDHEHAQVESQRYAKAIASLLDSALPNLMKLYRKYRRRDRLDLVLKEAKEIVSIVESVEGRCMAADGPVPSTLKEMTEDELRSIVESATNITSILG